MTEEDPLNFINSVKLVNGKPTKFSSIQIPWHAFSKDLFRQKKQKKEKKINKRKDKIHPVLKKMLAAKKRKSDKEQIIITFRDNLTIPRFPVLNPNESRTSRTNKIALKESENLVKEIREKRADTYKKLQERTLKKFNYKVLSTYWLVNAMLVEMSLKDIGVSCQRRKRGIYRA